MFKFFKHFYSQHDQHTLARNEVPNVSKDGVLGESLRLSAGGNGKVYGVVAVRSACMQRLTNACAANGARCAHMCLPRPDRKAQCVCSDVDLDDECLPSLN